MVLTDNANEWLPEVNEQGETIGKLTRGECHGGSKRLHPVVHLHVFDPAGRLYLQKRPEWKDIQPGKWDTAVGGHVDYGEDIETALRREAREELGLTDFEPEFLGRYVFESDRERELIHAFKATVNPSAPQPSAELAGGRFWTKEELKDKSGLTPNLVGELTRLFPDLAE